ncbi:Phospho-N-acetylmuramoyl-pentapeptide-transferase [Desulforamulus reducens MI-1]|uniref:Phospho-N-acetylmuramoyl-pentapeptide-transferase n=1 Tax=Desulforamulus reducens (strain ATCC BAA-1160 / DSM 100696 / MI-1) TaxID=349161 RepID=MRAY_DESRM|nr:phospho-N-acetylmuramoyl-pentapeptide-transferase [Desulforamulus reducens]A4J2A8.1 RecName: Full=Phospho-N-acetylmuramoyl-pentapeptide-transferase; AltName: Full=UDP-MurNAc-pentapeptide phosphotransferase [Desulforamulus reducens MI-1]ABO49211.1 Phospho-N-acetylmuramoyl-pentapeptide-transferase [Desulforamulus reducens MI-1]
MDYTVVWLAAGISFLVTLVLGPVTIPLLQRLKFGQTIRAEGPAAHMAKTGTPTMGGIMFLIGIAVAGAVLLVSNIPGRAEGLVVLAVTLGYGLIGFLDDFIKVVLKRNLGLKAREKILGQLVFATVLAVVAVFKLGRGTDYIIPFSSGISFDLGWWPFFFLTLFVLLGTSNGVNLTDGLDGLASGATVFTATAFAILALVTGKIGLAIVLAAVVGGCLGFLFYNRHPAKVFMGDTGSLALGGALGAGAVVTRNELLLVVIGGLYVLETLSVIIQVISFKTTGRRVFRMSPLHHHFELSGWSERKVVRNFWLLSFLFSLVGLLGAQDFWLWLSNR